MRDIINEKQYEVRLLPVTPEGGVTEGDSAEPNRQSDQVQHLEVINTQPETNTRPRELQEGEVVPEGQEPPKETYETPVPLTRERALQIFSERSNGRDLAEGEGVFEVVKRENGEIFSAVRIDAGATDPNARAASTRTQPGAEQPKPEVLGQTAPVAATPVSQERPQGDANRSTDPTAVAPGQTQPAQQKRRDR